MPANFIPWRKTYFKKVNLVLWLSRHHKARQMAKQQEKVAIIKNSSILQLRTTAFNCFKQQHVTIWRKKNSTKVWSTTRKSGITAMMSGTTTRKDNCKEILNREEVWNNRRKHVWDNRKDVWDNRSGGLSRWLSRWGRCQALPVRQGLDPRLDWSQHWNYFLGRYTSMFYRSSCLSKISIVTQVGELTNKQLRIVIILSYKMICFAQLRSVPSCEKFWIWLPGGRQSASS